MVVHHHLDPVELPDGTVIWAVGFAGGDYARTPAPDFGLYLDPAWTPPWQHAQLSWPDFGLPEDAHAMRRALVDALARARSGLRVEVGCLGGHGRTGTSLACMAVLAGLEDDPVLWVRSHYCRLAVETDDQETLARAFGR